MEVNKLVVLQPKPIDVQVVTHHMQRYAVWFGGSMLASTVSICLTRLSPFTFYDRLNENGRTHTAKRYYSVQVQLYSCPIFLDVLRRAMPAVGRYVIVGLLGCNLLLNFFYKNDVQICIQLFPFL
jgi:hypothetical protein